MRLYVLIFLCALVVGCSLFISIDFKQPVPVAEMSNGIFSPINPSDDFIKIRAQKCVMFAAESAMRNATGSSERTDIRNQLYSWANAFDSMASGDAVDPDTLRKTATEWNTKIDPAKGVIFLDQSSTLWKVVYPALSNKADPELNKEWLLLMSSELRAVAGEK